MNKRKSIELLNPRIVNFYETNPQINPEAVNILFVELIEKLLLDTHSAIHSQILNDIQYNTSEIKNSFSSITEILENNNRFLLEKTTNVLENIVPKTKIELQEILQTFQKTIATDTEHLVKTVDSQSLKDFVHNFEMKTSMLIQTLQQPLYAFISAGEERISNNMNIIKDGLVSNQSLQTKTTIEIENFLKKFRGNDKTEEQTFHNRQLSNVITRMYNSAEIHVQPSVLNSGSILLKRLRKPNILIENKDSVENISVEEINNFMILIEEQNCNGIFISQNSGISNKKNYQIEIVNNNIVVFLHQVEYCSAKISSAVDIIDNLTQKFRLFKDTYRNEDIGIPKDVLDNINTEYQLFISQKNAVIEVIKESQKKVISQLDEVRFPHLDKFLSTKFSMPLPKSGLKCELCKMFNANNLKALAAHKRGCNRKNGITTIT